MAFGDRHARVGPRERTVGGTRIWAPPSPGGLNAHWSPAALAEELARLRAAAFPADTALPDRAHVNGQAPGETAASPVASTS